MNEDKGFYRYIYESHNGYRIIYQGESYGWYDDIRWALYDRDRLESCNWDYGEFIMKDETDNPYLGMRLPKHNLRHWRQYIYPNGKSWRIAKRSNNELKVYGTFKTLDEAIKMRDKLIENEWII